MAHLKDTALMKQKVKEIEALHKLAQICQKAYRDGKKDVVYLAEILRDKEPSNTLTHPKHINCAGWYNKHNKETDEQQICRCMFYYGKNETHSRKCQFKRKWRHIPDDVDIIDYETPMPYKIEKIGKIDLCLKYDKRIYGVEVKPPENNDETISRMVSEILTYTIDFPNILPAIAVFENSNQQKRIDELDKLNNNDFKIIRKYVQVFIIRIVGKTLDNTVEYMIEPY